MRNGTKAVLSIAAYYAASDIFVTTLMWHHRRHDQRQPTGWGATWRQESITGALWNILRATKRKN